ncbi:pentapeptide repeat-containing protein [Pseudanabaena yagii]|uniref:Pentapeptide repeat-containing protein n=1 Tax=Pseudanabaena yagii GIHE-NHR1 TaxID=2722753 RepID=A0ABX1LKG8_9CYAN|nr:pentapeptide repeat-containing protein [Pseudanabaena yagii]NMF56615.1 hypothetical protein [Pseudanabaena yagii GIHE-NHR1]
MTLSFVGQDLRHQSFNGREDLAGADFTGADLRGCDFREAILTGANFTGVKTGQSNQQFIYLIEVTVAFTFMFVVIGSGASLGFLLGVIVDDALVSILGSVLGGFLGAVASGIVVSLVSFLTAFIARVTGGAGIVRVDPLMFKITLAIVSLLGIVVVIIVQAYKSFLTGNVRWGILCITASLVFIIITLPVSKELLETLKSSISTYFNGADLTGANFANAELQFTDFTDTNCDLINWQGAKFFRCKLPKNIEDTKVRNLCKKPESGRAVNYASANFHKAYLQNVDLVDAILHNANLNGADLRGAKLINADLSNSQALGTDFTGATLTGARIFNWGINPETKFENVICTHVYIDEAGKERKPASGDFAEGDFALLVGEFTNTLDFLFKNEINFSAFQYAMQQMVIKNPEVQLSINQTKFIGQNKDALKRSYDVSPDADKGKLHADFSESYDIYKRLHPEDNQLIRDLNRKLTFLEGEVKTLKVLNAEKDERIADLKDANAGFKEIAKTQATKSNDKIIVQQVQGEKNQVSDKNQNISLKSDGNMTGVTVAGGDISGTVTVTIQQLRDSDTPEAPKLADLLTDLQKAISESTELTEEDKTKALQYIDTIGKFANNKEDHDMIGTVIDKIIKVVSKAAKLLTPVQAIADGLRKILQL